MKTISWSPPQPTMTVKICVCFYICSPRGHFSAVNTFNYFNSIFLIILTYIYPSYIFDAGLLLILVT